MSWEREELRRAQGAYRVATEEWHTQRRIGGIEPLDPGVKVEHEEILKGCRYKAPTPAGRSVLSRWQMAAINLYHAAKLVRQFDGDESCKECDDLTNRMQPDEA